MLIHNPEGSQFDTSIFASDWRYSAAIIGLREYLRSCDAEFKEDARAYNPVIDCEDECFQFNMTDITEEQYIQFVGKFFGPLLQPCQLERKLREAAPLSEDDLKECNDLLTGQGSNTILKKIFNKEKISEENRAEILDTLRAHKQELVLETYRNKKNLYANYANTNMLLKEAGEACRLNGYYLDVPKKGKSQGYGFDKGRIDSTDSIIFDFIPFAFSGGRIKYFINNSYSIKQMIAVAGSLWALYGEIKDKADREGRRLTDTQVLWKFLIHIIKHNPGDIEIIVKDQDKGFFETVYVREKAMKILEGMEKTFTMDDHANPGQKKEVTFYQALSRIYKSDSNQDYIDIQKEVLKAVLQDTLLDKWIEFFLKENEFTANAHVKAVIHRLIEINLQIRTGGDTMKTAAKQAWACAQEVRKSPAVKENKLRTYRTKLLSAIVGHNYDKASQILLHLSIYSGIYFPFASEIFADFEQNKDVFYTFIEALGAPEKTEVSSSGVNE